VAADEADRREMQAIREQMDGGETRVLVAQTTVVDPRRLGRSAGRLEASELRAVDEALTLVLGL
jgi:mRNA interferase MazF